jgi:hypothetical protein
MDLQPVSLSELQEVEGGGHHKNDGFSLSSSYNQSSSNGSGDSGSNIVKE